MNDRDIIFDVHQAGHAQAPILQGRTAIITGAGNGIGREIALLFAHEGASVIASDKSTAAGEQTVAAIEAAKGRACFYPGDPVDPQYHPGLVNFARHCYGWLDIAINIVPTGSPAVPLADLSVTAWGEIVDTHLSGLFYAVRAQVPAIIEAGGGAIVNVGGIMHSPMPTADGAGIAPGRRIAPSEGIIALTKAVAADYAGQNIRANAVVAGATGPAMKPRGGVSGIAQVALFLASARSAPITGLCVPLDGEAGRR